MGLNFEREVFHIWYLMCIRGLEHDIAWVLLVKFGLGCNFCDMGKIALSWVESTICVNNEISLGIMNLGKMWLNGVVRFDKSLTYEKID